MRRRVGDRQGWRASMPCGGERPPSPCLTASAGDCVNAAPTAASDQDEARAVEAITALKTR